MECLAPSAWCNLLRYVANDLCKRELVVLAHETPQGPLIALKEFGQLPRLLWQDNVVSSLEILE
jgi:hypothetical protein